MNCITGLFSTLTEIVCFINVKSFFCGWLNFDLKCASGYGQWIDDSFKCGWLKAVPTWNIHEHARALLTRTAGEWQKKLILALPLISLFSWWGVSLIWRQTSLSRMCEVSAAWWSCWSTATSPARLKSGLCLPPSSEKVFETCKWALRWASSSRCCKDGAQ